MPTVLVVDDSDFTRRMMRKTLETNGFEVREANGGQQALELYADQPTNLVLLDLLMPGMEGEEVLTRLKEIDPNVRAIICSSNVQSSKQQELIDLGAEDYIVKPAKPDMLIAAVNKVLGT